MRLGIDFGTTRTVVAAVHRGRYPVVSFESPDGFSDYLPGMASLHPGGIRFGAEASRDPSVPILRSVKAAITGVAPDEPVRGWPAVDMSALQLTTEYLRFVRQMLVERSNLEVSPLDPLEVMVAVPANASTRQRYLTIEAFQRAGFQVLGLLNEPTAAAIEYAKNSLGVLSRRSPKRYVVVYDMGGGTFDTAAVSLVDRRFELLASEGIARLGGNDFDALIADLTLEAAGVARPELSDNAWAHLLERCRLAKETLTPASRKLFVDVADLLPCGSVVIEAARLYDIATPLVEQTIELMDRLFGELVHHGVDPGNSRELGAVYLVGGSVQFPAVTRLLKQRFKRKLLLAPQPHAATAVGLAIAADADAGVYVREAPTRHFGVWREAEAGREKIFDPIIQKRLGASLEGSVIAQRTYRPVHSVGRLRFVECGGLDDAAQPTGDLTPWGNVLFPYDPALLDCSELERHCPERNEGLASEEIVETYEYGVTGVIRVHIENRTSGYSRSYVLGECVGEGVA
ncbi:MAG: Hsp70 family protein [Myxococcales bacterium]|jgi:molecular chaperone DnaK (HSP70)|nr:Hsp70 family protein [Myxococcales bacterium]